MARDWNSYYQLLRSLLPRGRAWTPDNGTLKEFLQGKAVEFARVDARVEELLLERGTLTTTELIEDHELEFAVVPEPTDALSSRRAALNSKLRALGSLRKNYYIELATALGYSVDVTEYSPFWAGIGAAGDPCGDQESLFHWLMTLSYRAPVQTAVDIPIDQTGLVGWWRLDEAGYTGVANEVLDSGPNKLHGQCRSGQSLINQQALFMNGIHVPRGVADNKYLYVTNQSAIQLGIGTLAAWFSTSTNTYGAWQIIAGKANAWNLFVANTNLYTYNYGTSTPVASGVNVIDGKWHHAALVFSTVTNRAVLYVDGAPRKLITSWNVLNQLSQFQIMNSLTMNTPFIGSIDEVSVWNRQLTDWEIFTLFNTSQPFLPVPGYSNFYTDATDLSDQMNALKPAHTVVEFAKNRTAFDWSFNEAFDSDHHIFPTYGAYHLAFGKDFDTRYAGEFTSAFDSSHDIMGPFIL